MPDSTRVIRLHAGADTLGATIALRQVLRLRESPVGAWSFGVAAFLTALWLRFALGNELPFGIPYLTFFPAVILTAFLGGLFPSIAVSVASAIAAWYFFLPPYWSFELQFGTALSLALFCGVVAVDVTVIHVMYRALAGLDAEKVRSAELAEQRELMFRELQHRVSNNLGVVSALLNLQRADMKDESARQALAEAATRLALISKIHRKLHDPRTAGLRVGPFLEELASDVLEASGAADTNCQVACVEAHLSSDRAVPFALIAAELISNALEHGFGDGAKGTIRVDLKAEGDSYVLTVADDGKGLPEGFSIEAQGGMGLKIVRSLAGQLGGTFALEAGSPGAVSRVAFPV